MLPVAPSAHGMPWRERAHGAVAHHSPAAEYRIVVDDPRDVDALLALADSATTSSTPGPANNPTAASSSSTATATAVNTATATATAAATASAVDTATDGAVAMTPFERFMVAVNDPNALRLSTLRSGVSGSGPAAGHVQLVTLIRRIVFPAPAVDCANREIASRFEEMHTSLRYKLASLGGARCEVHGLELDVSTPDEDVIVMSLTGSVVHPASLHQQELRQQQYAASRAAARSHRGFRGTLAAPSASGGAAAVAHLLGDPVLAPQDHEIILTPLHYVPGAAITESLGVMMHHFVRESIQLRDVGGAGGFTHALVASAHAVVRAHVASLDADALINLKIEFIASEVRNDRNRAYGVCFVSGDVVRLGTVRGGHCDGSNTRE
jgi:hypothetical protein